MTASLATSPAAGAAPPRDRRWLTLGVIALAQLMVVLDASIVTIALPDAQSDLGISNADRQWVQTAYTLAFGGLLLLGGRIADYTGRKRAFIIGLVGFAIASTLGGVAPTAGLLFAARALQGAMAALLAPAALSLITTTFTEPRERARAFAVFGGISGGGAAIGLVAGGLLTDLVSWRWCLLVNVPIAVLAIVAAVPLVQESRLHADRHYDMAGTVLSVLGLVALVYGFTRASTEGWGSTSTLTILVVAVLLLLGFIAFERQAEHPMLPLRILADSNRGGSYVTLLISGIALFGVFLFLTFYFQGTLHYSPLKAGVLFLPFSAGIIVSAGVASQLLPRFGPRPMATAGMVLGGLGLLWLTQISVHASFLTHVLGPELLISVGMAQVFVSLSSTALVGVEPDDAGVASALVNTVQQVGGSLGTALLNTIATSATARYARGHPLPVAIVHGYTVAFAVSVGLFAVGAVLVALMVRARNSDLPTEGVIGGA